MLGRRLNFSLLCAYAKHRFDVTGPSGMQDVCDLPSHVAPTEPTEHGEDEPRARQVRSLHERTDLLRGEIEKLRHALGPMDGGGDKSSGSDGL